MTLSQKWTCDLCGADCAEAAAAARAVIDGGGAASAATSRALLQRSLPMCEASPS
jgi:hypothetical protein